MKDRFHSLLSSYIIEPSEELFHKLKDMLKDMDEKFTIEFLEILWSRIGKSSGFPIILKHLGFLLMIRGRRIESEYYLLRWIEQNENDIEALEILQFIAAERANLTLSDWCINQLEKCNASEETMLNAKICHYLVSGHDNQSQVLVYELIQKGFKSPRSVSSLIQVALRNNDWWIAQNALNKLSSKLAIDSLGEGQKGKLFRLACNALIKILKEIKKAKS